MKFVAILKERIIIGWLLRKNDVERKNWLYIRVNVGEETLPLSFHK